MYTLIIMNIVQIPYETIIIVYVTVNTYLF